MLYKRQIINVISTINVQDVILDVNYLMLLTTKIKDFKNSITFKK